MEGQLFSSAASLRQKTHVPVPYKSGNNNSFLEISVSCKKTYRKFNSIATRENSPRDLFPIPWGRKKPEQPRDFLQLRSRRKRYSRRICPPRSPQSAKSRSRSTTSKRARHTARPVSSQAASCSCDSI